MSVFNNIEYQKEYYKNNKNKLLEKLKNKSKCDLCGGSYSYVGRNRHNLSNKHIRSLNKNENISSDDDLMNKVKQFIIDELNKKK
jgi:hypothetical protein